MRNQICRRLGMAAVVVVFATVGCGRTRSLPVDSKQVAAKSLVGGWTSDCSGENGVYTKWTIHFDSGIKALPTVIEEGVYSDEACTQLTASKTLRGSSELELKTFRRFVLRLTPQAFSGRLVEDVPNLGEYKHQFLYGVDIYDGQASFFPAAIEPFSARETDPPCPEPTFDDGVGLKRL